MSSTSRRYQATDNTMAAYGLVLWRRGVVVVAMANAFFLSPVAPHANYRWVPRTIPARHTAAFAFPCELSRAPFEQP